MLIDNSNLTLTIDEKFTVNTEYGDIEVKAFLPMKEKLDLVADIVNASIDDNNYYNPCRVAIMKTIKILTAYTNVELSEEALADEDWHYKLYDQCIHGWLVPVYDQIPSTEIAEISYAADDVVESVYRYNNSARGIAETLMNDYDNLNFDTNEITEKLSNKENLKLVRDVLDKLS